jgi:predicted amidohydrolase/ribosomal protein S18 acetylase RimI-like enzyme
MGELDLRDFETQIKVRPLRIDDYDSLVELQLKCFPGMRPWTREQIQSQLKIFPEGQIGIEYMGDLVASSSSLILDFDIYTEKHGWREISDNGFIRNHNPNGNTLYGIEIMVDPAFRNMKLARRLYDARKKLAEEHNLERIVIGGRIPGYDEHAAQMKVREYIDKVMERSLHDPVLTAQLANGFVLKRILPGYMQADRESRGYAALLEWTNLDYIPYATRELTPIYPVRVCTVQYQMRQISSFEEFSQQCEYFVDVASGYRCDFILFPDRFTTQLLTFLKTDRPALAMRKLAEFTPQYLDLFTSLAVKYNINIVGGSQFTIEDDKLYVISYLFRRDGTLGKQYKLHITPEEHRWWGVTAGDSLEVLETDRGKITIQISSDVEFPELTRIAVDKGAQILFVPFSAEERSAYLRIRYCAQARCIENYMYAVIAGSVGNLPMVENIDIHYAQSGVYTPADIQFSRDGISAECSPNIETVIIDDFDLELLKESRQSKSVVTWRDRRSDLYKLTYES